MFSLVLFLVTLLTRTAVSSNVANEDRLRDKEKQGPITRTLSSVRSNSLAENGSMIRDSANADDLGIFEPKVKAHGKDYEPSSRRPPQTTTG